MNILITIITLCLIVTLNYTIKYFKIKKILNKPLRYGYYEIPMHLGELKDFNRIEFTPRVHVIELERYTNDMSKISMYKIEYMVSDEKVNHLRIKKFLTDNFTEIMKTNNITWLEQEISLKQQRKNKLDTLFKSKLF